MMTKPKFSQRHPFLFGTMLLLAAMALFPGALAAFRFWDGNLVASFRQRDKALGVVRVEGVIANSEEIVSWLEELGRDDHVRGVLVRINSPGGVVAPSQEIFHAIKRLSERKPVVASMGSVAASGGYYVAAAADRIMASAGTLTGSIGVRLELINFRELADDWGITQTQFVSGDLKGAGSPFQPLTDEERAYFEALVMDMHDQFVSDVSSARDMDKDRVRALADGRAFTGRQAFELGLVDELGGMSEAMEVLKTLAGVSGRVPLKDGPPDRRDFIERITSRLDVDPAAELSKLFGPRWMFMQ